MDILARAYLEAQPTLEVYLSPAQTSVDTLPHVYFEMQPTLKAYSSPTHQLLDLPISLI